MAAFDAQQVGMSLWSLAVLRVSPGEEFVMAAVRQAELLLTSPEGRAISIGRTTSGTVEVEMQSLNTAPSTTLPRASSGKELTSHFLLSRGRGGMPHQARQATAAVFPTAIPNGQTPSSSVSEPWVATTIGVQDQLACSPHKSHAPPAAPSKGLETSDMASNRHISVGTGERSRPVLDGFPAASLAQLCYGLCILNDRPMPSLARALTDFMTRPIRSPKSRDSQGRQERQDGRINLEMKRPSDSRHQPSGQNVEVAAVPPHGYQAHRLSGRHIESPSLDDLGGTSILSDIGPRELMLLLMGLSNLGCRPGPDEPWLEPVLQRLEKLMAQTLSGRSVSRRSPRSSSVTLFGMAGTLWCLAQMGACPPVGWMQSAERSLIKLMERERRVFLSPRYNNTEGGHTSARHLVPPLTTVRLLAAFGALGYRPSPMLGAILVDSLCHHLPKIPNKRIVSAMHAIVDLDLPASPLQLRSLAFRSMTPGDQRSFRSRSQ